ncbi:MAG: ABC transporter substrate-binding protein [Deltaproteobacteria bacterium]|nr:ABC transporter substrate-binding protein [Deltaproteobacteria bacterium]
MRASLIVDLALALVLVACAPKAPDAATPSAASPRVVSVAPAITAIVRAVGGDAHLVGVTSWCDAPGVPVIGDLKPRPEAVLAARPDVVWMAGYGSQSPDAAALAALGLQVETLPLVTLGDMLATTRTIGLRLGRGPAGAALVQAFEAARAEALRLRGDAAPVKVLVVYDVQPGFVITTGGGDHIMELLELAGAKNVATGPLTLRLGLEAVLAAAPELILHVAPDTRFPDSEAARTHWATWAELPAVRRGEVHVYPGDGLARNGPHLSEVLPRLSQLVQHARQSRDAERR